MNPDSCVAHESEFICRTWIWIPGHVAHMSMSCCTYECESCHTYGGMSGSWLIHTGFFFRIWIYHVACMNMRHVAHENILCCTYECESCHTYGGVSGSWLIHTGFFCHMNIWRCMCEYASCRAYEYVMLHTWIWAYHTYGGVSGSKLVPSGYLFQLWMCHIARMNESHVTHMGWLRSVGSIKV